MKYHLFTNLYQRKYLTAGDYCAYCKILVEDLYLSLSELDKKEYKKIEYFRNECNIYFAHKTPCVNGITQEEYLIKKLIE